MRQSTDAATPLPDGSESVLCRMGYLLGELRYLAAAAVLELLQEDVQEFRRELKIAAAPSSLQQLEQRVSQEDIVIEIGVEMRVAILVGCQ
jgi:hypothetical protein